MRRATGFSAALSAAIFLTAAGIATSAAVRHDSVARFSARTVEMTSPARLLFTRVDINIGQWSTDLDHRTLARTILEQGPVAFSHTLAGYPRLGTITAGAEAFTIRYAWQVPDREGGQRIYLASDEPIFLMSREFRKFADPEPLLFVELRVNARGDGIGRLSDAVRLSADEGRNVIEMRDWDRRPLHLVMVHDELGIVD
jgi:hypothetical protein